MFRGADDPMKLKGVKFTKGYSACIWLEELDQFEGLEAVRSILNSLRRGGDKFWIFYSYNPPKTMWSWVNVERLERKRRADTLVMGSSYLDVAETHLELLGEPFIMEAEYLRDTNEQAWRWEYLGEITGAGGAVFDNVREARLSDSRIRGFERVRNGVEWGWFPDPWRFVRRAWEPSERRLLIFEEHSANKMMPIDTGKIVVDSLTFPDEEGGEPYFHNQIVYADDTPDSKVQMNMWRRELGIRVHAARKARMRRLSYERLAGLREIVIDPDRCPLTFAEFTLKEFERDKEGNWIDDIPDGNDHSIDAVRYAMLDDMLRS